MSDGRKYYCFCDSNCKFETMTKEQILTAIAQAIADGKVSNADAGFITKVKETNGGKYVTFWVGTQAEYNALPEIATNCLYIITDETAVTDLNKLCNDVVKMGNDVAAIKSKTDSMVAYVEAVGVKTDNRYQTIKYSNGYAESTISLQIPNVPLTTSFGGFYTWGGARRLTIGGIDNKPAVFTVTVDGVQKYDSEGNLVAGPEAFAMVSGTAEYNSETGVCQTPFIEIAANAKEAAAIVHLTFHVRWRWK